MLAIFSLKNDSKNFTYRRPKLSYEKLSCETHSYEKLSCERLSYERTLLIEYLDATQIGSSLWLVELVCVEEGYELHLCYW